MSKQITAQELAAIVSKLLTKTEAAGQLDSRESFEGFMTDIARVVCDYCGGEVRKPASVLDATWYVGVHANESLPEDGGVWKDHDREGELGWPVDLQLQRLGFALISTGGGCSAWHLKRGSMYMLVTDDDGSSATNLDESEPLYVGINDDTSPNDNVEVETAQGAWSQVRERIEQFAATDNEN